MKTLSANMQTHVESGSTRLAWAATFTRRDGVVLRYVSGSRDITLDGNAYLAQPGFNLSSITCSPGSGVVDTLEITVLPSDAVERLDFLTGRWFGARVEFNQYNWSSSSDGFIPWPTYRVANVKPIDGAFVLELRDVRMLWRQDYTLTTGKTCLNRLGDDRCGVNLATWTEVCEVTAVTNRRTFTIDLAEAADWATEGLLTFADGPYADLPLWIADHATGGVITLAESLVQDIVVGQEVSVIAGCLGRREDCRDKFDNILRMRAPGLDAKTLEQLTEEE